MAAFKKNCVLLGVGARKKGVGKTSGLPYDFMEVCVGVPRKNWEGVYCVRGRIAGERADVLPLVPGVNVECIMFYENYELQLIDVVAVCEDRV